MYVLTGVSCLPHVRSNRCKLLASCTFVFQTLRLTPDYNANAVRRKISLERMVSAFALSRGRDVGGQEQLQESPWLAKLDVQCSGFSEKYEESHGNPVK